MRITLMLSIAVLLVFSLPHQLPAQNALPPEVAEHGYADMIVLNGKVVSMDDAGLNESPGNVYEAIATKKDRIIALGTSERLRTLAGPNTRIIDLEGQTLIPGIVETHVHLFGGGDLAAQVGLQTHDRGINIRVQAGKDIETTRLRIENAIKDAVTKVEPDDWIVVGLRANPQEGVDFNRLTDWIVAGGLESRERLDAVSPENPVLVRGGIRGYIDSLALEKANEFMPAYSDFIRQSMYSDSPETGLVGTQEMGVLTWEIWYRDKPISLIAEMFRRDLERAAAHGVTTFSSRVGHPRILDGFMFLNREKKLPIRFAMLYEVHRNPNDPDDIRKFYGLTGNLTGLGNDYLWVHGVASERWDTSFPMGCLGPDVAAPPKIKAREVCPQPGEMWWDTLQTALESGWRLAGIHGLGSHGVRLFIQLLETGMKNSGMTAEDIRNLRPTVEHATVIGKLPDVIAGLKKYGIIVSAGPPRLLRYPAYREDYGPAIDEFMLPIKTLLDQGVQVVGQNHTYRQIGYLWTVFMNRKVGDKVVGPDERLGRVTVLKMWTKWASNYVMKEDDLGSLEIGKLADFLVLDKDFFTIPESEIPNIVPQMTVVGGETRYLGTEFAGKLGMEPVGYQFPEGYSPWAKSPGR